MELRLEDIMKQVDAMESEIKNLQNNVVKVAKDIRERIEWEFKQPII